MVPRTLSLYEVHWISINNSSLLIFQAMTTIGDNVTGTLVQMLKQRGMWDNTIMLVSSDNGGQPCYGSNYPLKGAKITFFEGGVRNNAFLTGGFLPANLRGMSLNGFIHIADWYATFCQLAGVDPSDSAPGIFDIDSVDLWPLITGQVNYTARRYITLGYDYNSRGAIIDTYTGSKLIVGSQVGLDVIRGS